MSIIILAMTVGRIVISLMILFGSSFISKQGSNEDKALKNDTYYDVSDGNVLKKDTNDVSDGEVETGLPL